MLIFFTVFILLNLTFIFYMIYMNFNKLKNACNLSKTSNIVIPVDKNGITVVDGLGFSELINFTSTDDAKKNMNGTFNNIFT